MGEFASDRDWQTRMREARHDKARKIFPALALALAKGDQPIGALCKAFKVPQQTLHRWRTGTDRTSLSFQADFLEAKRRLTQVQDAPQTACAVAIPPGEADLAIWKFRFTRPQAQVEAALNDPLVHTVVFRASNRNGKTASVIDIAGRAMRGAYSWCPVPARVCIVSLSKPQAAGAIQPYFEQFFMTMPDWAEAAMAPKYAEKARRTTREELTNPIRLKNGSVLFVKTAEMGWEHLQGAGYHLVIFDEEPDEQTFKEMRIRMIAGATQKRLFTMTPLKGETWIKEKVEGKPGVVTITAAMWENGQPPCATCGHDRTWWTADLEKRGLLRQSENHLALKQSCPRCHTFGVEPHYSKTDLDALETEYAGPEFAVRFYGEWKNVRGGKCFEPDELEALKTFLKDGATEGGGRCWSEPKPGHAYAVGVDAAEGLGGERDETVIDVLDLTLGEQVYCLGDNWLKPEQYRGEVLDLAQRYGHAMVNAESLGEGRVLLQGLKHSNILLYRHRSPDRRYLVSGEDIGWRPSQRGRDLLLRNLFAAIRKNLYRTPDGKVHAKSWTGPKGHPTTCDPTGIVIRDAKTLEQLASLVFNAEKANRIEPPGHKHDDRVFGLALAHECRISRDFSVGDRPEDGWAEPAPGTVEAAMRDWWRDWDAEPVVQEKDREPYHPHPLDEVHA